MWPAIAILLLLAVGALLFWQRKQASIASAKITRLHAEAQAAAQQHRNTLADLVARQETLFDSMIEGFLVIDAAGRIQFANRASFTLTNSAGEIRGRTVIEAFRIPALNDLVQQAAQTSSPGEVELDWPGSPPRHLRINAAPLAGPGGTRQGVILILHDLTRLRQLENTRQEFVANVSHELRTPLSLIKGCAETLLDGAKDDPVTATRFLQTILRHADRLASLIDDLLTLSRLESGRVALDLQPSGLHDCAQAVMDDLHTAAASKEIALRNEIDPSLLVQADASRLQQVLFNLVDNGIKYGKRTGFVELSAQRTEDGMVEICARDNGAGIPAEACERVFERFFRVDRARSREQGGTGLGLSIVKHLVQSHGGKVWVKSGAGQGSAFYFTLPDAASQEKTNTRLPPS